MPEIIENKDKGKGIMNCKSYDEYLAPLHLDK